MGEIKKQLNILHFLLSVIH